MGKCSTKIERIEIDLSDEQITKIVVEIDYWGDCPTMNRRYEKSFPARIPVVDLFTIDGGIKDHLLW